MPLSDYTRNLRQKIGNDLLMMPGAGAVIVNSHGQVLLQHRADNGLWGIPGGLIEPGEEPADTAIREVYEETGLHIELERVVGVYGGRDFFVTYNNGDQAAIISILFRAHPVDETVAPFPKDGESLALKWFSPDALPENMEDRHRVRIGHALNDAPTFFQITE